MSSKEQPDKPAELRRFVGRKVAGLQDAYAPRGGERPNAWAAATMAALRNADPAKPGDDPALWEVTFGEFPEALTWPGSDTPSPWESAAHAALCLYAVHQQSRSDHMHTPDVRFGEAVRSLAVERSAEAGTLDAGVIRRFHVVGTAATDSRRLSALRGLLKLMRSARPGTPFDYGRFACDLLWLANPRTAPGVRLAWGRDLRRAKVDTPPNTTTTSAPDTPDSAA